MKGFLTYFLPIIITCSSFNLNAQFLCDYELKVITNHKKTIKKKCSDIANLWILENGDELDLPIKLKLSKIQVKTKEGFDESKKWKCIDSLLCLNKGEEIIERAIKKMSTEKLAVYDIRTYFNYANSENPAIKSILYFQFDIDGNLLRAVIREKEDSPYSEKYYH